MQAANEPRYVFYKPEAAHLVELSRYIEKTHLWQSCRMQGFYLHDAAFLIYLTGQYNAACSLSKEAAIAPGKLSLHELAFLQT